VIKLSSKWPGACIHSFYNLRQNAISAMYFHVARSVLNFLSLNVCLWFCGAHCSREQKELPGVQMCIEQKQACGATSAATMAQHPSRTVAPHPCFCSVNYCKAGPSLCSRRGRVVTHSSQAPQRSSHEARPAAACASRKVHRLVSKPKLRLKTLQKVTISGVCAKAQCRSVDVIS